MTRELFVDVGGYRVAARDWGGAGRPLVLLHGGGANLASFDALAPLLVGDFRVVGIDVRSHGQSDPAPQTEPEAARREVDAVCDELGLKAPIVAGSSMGGGVASSYAAYGHRCSGVVAIDGATPFSVDEVLAREPTDPVAYERELREWGFGWIGDQPEFEERLAQTLAEEAESGIDPALLEAEFRRAHDRLPDGRLRRKPTIETLVELRLLGERLPLEDRTIGIYERIDCPVLLLCADRGVLNGDEHRARLDALPQRRPNVEVEWLDGGHRLELERPEEVARRILAFAATRA